MSALAAGHAYLADEAAAPYRVRSRMRHSRGRWVREFEAIRHEAQPRILPPLRKGGRGGSRSISSNVLHHVSACAHANRRLAIAASSTGHATPPNPPFLRGGIARGCASRDDPGLAANVAVDAVRGWLGFHCLAAALLCLAIQFVAPHAVNAQPPPLDPLADPEQIPAEFDDIFSQSEFRGLREKKPQPADSELPEWLKKFFDWLADLFRGTGNTLSGLGTLVQVLAYGVLAAICCLIIWLVVRAVNNYRARQTVGGRGRGSVEEGEGEIPPGDLPADEYLRRAAELAEQGLFREAIGQLILGAMSRTERGGLIRFRRGLTNRDYLRALRRRAMQHHAFRTLVGVYEPICFGRRSAQIEHYRTSLDGYQTGFQQPLPAEMVTAREAPAGAT